MPKPNIKTLKQSAELFECELSGGSIKAAIKSLNDYFTDNYEEDDLAACPSCDNAAPENGPDGKLLASCPFCGASFAPVPSEEAPASKPKVKPKRNKPNVPKKPKIAKKKKAEELVEHIATPEQKEELEEHVNRIEELRNDVARNTHDIGNELNQINDKALWRGLGHDSFFAYCKEELDFSRATAYKYMLVAREFDREEFSLIGVKKGELIAGAPERHKKKLKNAAVKKGKSFTELRSQLDKLEGKQRGANAGTEASKEKAPSEKMSLLGKVKKGEEVEIPWIDAKTHEAIEHKDVKGRYLIISLTDEVELILIPSEDEMGVIANFRKVGEVKIEEEPETEETDEEEVEDEDDIEETEDAVEEEEEEVETDDDEEDEDEESEDEEESEEDSDEDNDE